jgi:hypothetical protein
MCGWNEPEYQSEGQKRFPVSVVINELEGFRVRKQVTRQGKKVVEWVLEHLQKEISEKEEKGLALLQVISDRVVIAPSRDRARWRERHLRGVKGGNGRCAH